MDNLILNFVNDNFTPEHGDYVKRGIHLLSHLGYRDFESVIIDIINEVEQAGIEATVDAIFSKLNETLLRSYKLFGLEVNVDINYQLLIETLETIIDLENLYDASIALDILDNEPDMSTALAEVLSLLTDQGVFVYLEMFERISPNFIKRLKEILKVKVENKEPLEVDEQEARLFDTKLKLFKQYRSFTHGEMGFLNHLIEVDIPFLLPFNTYLNIILEQEETDIGKKAKSVVGAALICEEDKAPDAIIREHMDYLDGDPVQAVKLESTCRDIVNLFQQYLAQEKLRNDA